jgi:tetratricopeptide (TPR) repeat protein
MLLPKTPAILLSAILLVTVAASAFAQSQPDADGFTVQERSGIVLVKPQAWSKESEAVVVEFQAFIDRTASGAAGAGYIEFRTKTADRRQVPTPRIVKMVVYPDPKLVTEVVTQKDRDSLAAVSADLKATIVKFPATRTYVEPAMTKVNEEVAIYDSGKVKTNGAWINKDKYEAERARTFVNQIKPDILNAEPPSSFDLTSDPRYLALVELAKTNASVKPHVAELSAIYGKRVRREQRAALLIKLAEPELTYAEAQGAVTRLKSLNPEEDKSSELFLKKWDAGVSKLSAVTDGGKTLSAALEREMASVKAEDTLPEISPDLDKQIAALNVSLAGIVSSQPPAPILAAVGQAQAVCSAASALGKAKVLFASRQYTEAKDALDNAGLQSKLIGPETTRVLVSLSRVAATSIAEFSRLREEGKVQADANKPAEALAAYEKAFAVIPDPAVGEQIAQLKDKLPKKK